MESKTSYINKIKKFLGIKPKRVWAICPHCNVKMDKVCMSKIKGEHD